MTPPPARPKVVHGDCLDIMRMLPDNSVDSIVTDPPYGLGFMGKAWDALPPGLEWAEECLRVLKPGGHLLAFGGTRTWHRLAVAVEDAGFEIRDSIAWMYGSGFPKSHDVSKGIDKARTEDKEPTRVICRAIRAAMDVRDLRSRDLAGHFDGCHPRLIDHWAARDTDSQPSLPKWDQWERLCEMFSELSAHDSEVWRLNGRKGSPGSDWEGREVTGSVEAWENRTNFTMTTRDGIARDSATEGTAAAQWQGWGTALKPAFEPVVVARKPFKGTVAANVQQWGTGALNIDGTRIGTETVTINTFDNGAKPFGGAVGEPYTSRTQTGRWPANVVLDEHAAEELDQQSGVLKHHGLGRGGGQGGAVYGGGDGLLLAESRPHGYLDNGGASRFFYVAKAPKKERPVVDGVAHATVKPLALMRWLVKLVTPPGGTVLEPFAGSGTTVEACILEGFHCIAIEREAEYLPLIQARIDRQDAA